MSPAPIAQGAAASPASASATPPQQLQGRGDSPQKPLAFDDVFNQKFMAIIQQFKDNPRRAALTQKDRKDFIETAYCETDQMFYGNRPLSDHELKMRAMAKVFFKVLCEEPWSDDWIRPHDVERKLSRFEMHKDSVELAAGHGLHTPRDAIAAARQHQIALEKLKQQDRPGVRGPYDDIEIIYIPGTVSSTATNKIDRESIYPVSVASVANILHTHVCRDMTRPHDMAEKFVTCTDTEELTKLRQFACDVVDYAPHLLDNDNVSLLIVLLVLARSEICKRFENNGIRIEGSTISHRRAECLKQKLGWKTADERRQFDNVAIELQTRVKNACFPAPRTSQRIPKAKSGRKSSTPVTPATPPIGLFSSPQFPVPRPHPYHFPLNNDVSGKKDPQGKGHDEAVEARLNFPNAVLQAQGSQAAPGSSREDPMDLS